MGNTCPEPWQDFTMMARREFGYLVSPLRPCASVSGSRAVVRGSCAVIHGLPAPGAVLLPTRVGASVDIAVFSGVEVKPAPVDSADGNGMSWTRTILIAFIFLIVLGLFGGLIYFVLRFSEGKPLTGETISA